MRSEPKATPISSNYRWSVVGMLWCICFFNYADRQAIFSLFPLFEKQLGFSKADLGLIGAAFTWVYALTAPFAGQVTDRFPRKQIILGGLTVWSLITGMTALCAKVWHFVLVRGAEGLGETFYFPASMSMISDYHGPETRSRAMSLHQTSVYVGTIGGGAIAGWMGMVYGWRTPFLAFGLGGVLLGFVLASFIREPVRNAAENAGTKVTAPDRNKEMNNLLDFLKECLQSPEILRLMLAFFGANFVALIFLTWMPTFLKEKFGLNLALAGVSATVFIQTASAIGSIVGGLLADRWRQRLAGGRALVQAMGTLGGAPFLFLCGWTRELPVLLTALTFFGFFKGLYDANIWAALYDVVPAARRGTAVGLTNMVGWLGGGLGSLVVGVIVSRGVSMSLAISSTALIYLMVSALLFVNGVKTAKI